MASAAGECHAHDRPVVRTPSGRLRGRHENGVAVFRGVPFAEPPVGARRFAAPRPARRWSGVREAATFGPPPPQGVHFGMDSLTQEGAGDDWLTVNVWSPDPGPDAGLPVLVWVQGGGYEVGTSGLAEYDGARLARTGPVVVVTFNYRVGVEGFAQLAGAPPNRGLLDQVAALTWVRENVHAFGGNPDLVTVFGQSAGAGSVAALLAMPQAVGLFRRAVVQSMPGTFFAPDLAGEVADACAAELGLRASVADLSRVVPQRLCVAAATVGASLAGREGRWGRPAYRAVLFSPVVDGVVLTATPWEALADGAARDRALLVGHTRDEERLFSAVGGLLGEIGEEQAADALETLAPRPDGPARYRSAYPAAGPEALFELVRSDWLFRMPSLHLAEAQLTGGGRVHVYELTWAAPGMGGVLGACHGLDVPLVFGNLDRGQTAMLVGAPPSTEAETVSTAMRASLDLVRRSRGSRVAGVRQAAASRAVLRRVLRGHRRPRGGLSADLGGLHVPSLGTERVRSPMSVAPGMLTPWPRQAPGVPRDPRSDARRWSPGPRACSPTGPWPSCWPGRPRSRPRWR